MEAAAAVSSKWRYSPTSQIMDGGITPINPGVPDIMARDIKILSFTDSSRLFSVCGWLCLKPCLKSCKMRYIPNAWTMNFTVCRAMCVSRLTLVSMAELICTHQSQQIIPTTLVSGELPHILVQMSTTWSEAAPK